MEIECLNYTQDDFTHRFAGRDGQTLSFYQNLTYDEKSIKKVMDRPSHPHTGKLADIMAEGMAPYGLSDKQEDNLKRLREGARVIVGGQQAGLFMGPSMIMHKMLTLLVLVEEVKENHNYQAVPVFWIAGEDHDFEEVNHTHIYDRTHRRRRKISYKPNLTVPMSLGFYRYDQSAMKDTLDRIVEECGDSGYLKEKKSEIEAMIEQNEYWTELFHALVHDVFADAGLLIFNSHDEAVRKLEAPMFKKMIENHEAIDAAFRQGQQEFIEAHDLSPTIDTETNVHLFSGSRTTRTLLDQQGGSYLTDKGTLSKDALLEYLEQDPASFSNNVVTRPLMQEMLFNTLIFAGGGAEVKYWGELHKVFEVMDINMPIVLKRMEIIHEDMRLNKLLDKYGLEVSENLAADAEAKKQNLIESATDTTFLDEVDSIADHLDTDYSRLKDKEGREAHRDLIEANLKVHKKQLSYLKRRYQLEVKRTLRKELNDLEEISERLMPGGSLQERIYHPWMFPIDLEVGRLAYTTQLTIIKGI